MLKINIVAVGKVKEKYFAEGINEYLKRLTRFAEVKIIEVKEEVCPKETDGEIKSVIKREGESILPLLKGYVIALCIEGKKLSSEDLSLKIKEIAVNGDSEITFVIGGSYGLSDRVKNLAFNKVSFSDMTFPHTLFRLMLTEQIYRAFSIINNSPYHK